jgi:hypothetical protein
MPFNGTGTFNNLYDWTKDFDPATGKRKIDSTKMQAQDTDIAAALSNCLTRDGQGKPLTALDFNGQNLSNVNALSATSGSFAKLTFSDNSAFGTAPSGRNRLINGNFDLWQAGTSITATTSFQYLADQWRFKTGSGTATFVRNAHAVANAAYGTWYGTFLLASNGASEMSQPIENVRTLAGQTITISFYANIFSGSAQSVTVFAAQAFGSGGSPSANATTSSNVTVNNTGFARYTVTLTLPSLSGKTIGTNGDDQLVVGVTLPNGTYNFDTFGWQVEAGGVATPFEFRPIALELVLCQRYFCRPPSDYNVSPAMWRSGTTGDAWIKFPITMRAAPTFTSTGTFGAFNYTTGTPYTVTGVVLTNSTVEKALLTYTVASGGTAGACGLFDSLSGNLFFSARF